VGPDFRPARGLSQDLKGAAGRSRGFVGVRGSMTKAELVEAVSRVSDLTRKHSEVIVEAVFTSIIDALQKGDKIELRGFGSFRVRRRRSRTGRNPKTGAGVVVPAKKVPHFKPGKELRELINRA
jgi:integration host factor subunit beta